MAWLKSWFHRRQRGSEADRQDVPLAVERLESRTLLDATPTLAGGVLTILGGPNNDRINVVLDVASAQLIVQDGGRGVGSFSSAAVGSIMIDAAGGDDVVRIGNNILQPVTILGGPGNDVLYGGGGPALLIGGDGNDKLIAGADGSMLFGNDGNDHLFGGPLGNSFDGGAGTNLLYNVKNIDLFVAGPNDTVVREQVPAPGGPLVTTEILLAGEVDQLLRRAAAASASNDGIIAIVDRGGRILGVRVEAGVAPNILANNELLIFAIDGALAKARTAAFFGNNQAPLTSRTVEFISQSTMIQREIDSYPSITDPNSTLRGPGFVAPIGLGGHFPPRVSFTPQVDLFAIEHTNRDSLLHPGPDRIKGTPDDILLPNRFNIPSAVIPPGATLTPPESYGFERFPAGNQLHNTQARGISTLPGGIPIYKNNQVVGGIGVFFPGTTGFASAENSRLSDSFNPALPDRSQEAEYIAFAAVGGSPSAGATIGAINGVPALPGFGLPSGRIDLVGITLDVFGPGGNMGVLNLLVYGSGITVGDPDSGWNVPIDTTGTLTRNGQLVPEGYLVAPHAGSEAVALSADDVTRIINQGIAQANITRAAIRLPLGTRTKMVFAVSDTQGNILGLFRMTDATVFSIDVAVAKARNEAYYADADELQAVDQVPGVPAGAALTNRTFRYLSEPFYPEGINGAPPGPFSILNDGGTQPFNALNSGPPLPASSFNSVLGFDAFHPGSNFRDPIDIANQNGVVFFPGAVPLYKDDGTGNRVLVGGLGVSGDGVLQDDVMAFAAAVGYEPPPNLRADFFSFGGARLPYQKFLRNPEG